MYALEEYYFHYKHGHMMGKYCNRVLNMTCFWEQAAL